MKRWSLVLVVAGLMAMAWCGGAVRPAKAAAIRSDSVQINAQGAVVWLISDWVIWGSVRKVLQKR